MPPVPWLHAFVDVPGSDAARAREFWSAVTTWPASRPWSAHPEFVSLQPPTGTSYLHVQTISGRPRVHLDLLGDVEAEVDRLQRLGARAEHDGDGWFTLRSPAGLPFCVCGEPDPHDRPPAVAIDGHRTRLVQLCVDVPAQRYDAEWEFWQAATGWAEESVRPPEFRRLVHRAESPLQLLVQRLGDADPGTTARAHLDLGTTDLPREVERVRALGATVLGVGSGYTALLDPVGLPFCVTGNDPDR